MCIKAGFLHWKIKKEKKNYKNFFSSSLQNSSTNSSLEI